MKTYFLVKGKPGVLIGDPFSDRFIGQKKRVLQPGERPKNIGAAYEPIEMVVPKHTDILKHINRGELEVLATFEAESMVDALAKPARHAETKPKEKK